jgi:biotin-(acetyl-CoA carboxylase) ligase
LDEVGSTNSYARALAAEGPFDGGIAVIADHQLAGRGRLGKAWLSRRGKSLSMSILLGAEPGAGGSALLTLTAACSVAKAIEAACGDCAAPMIKWPNDIVCGGKKVCGILVEAGSVAVTGAAAGGENAIADAGDTGAGVRAGNFAGGNAAAVGADSADGAGMAGAVAAGTVSSIAGAIAAGTGARALGAAGSDAAIGNAAIGNAAVGGDGLFSYAIIGIGVNVNLDAEDMPPEISGSATSLKLACGQTRDFDTERLAAGILSAFCEDCRTLAGYGAGRVDGTDGANGAEDGGACGNGRVGGTDDAESASGASVTVDTCRAGSGYGTGSAGGERGMTGAGSERGNGCAGFSEGSPLREYYMARCASIGRELTVVQPGGSFGAMGVGISPEGHLIVELAGGERRELVSGEVSVRGICGYV